VSKKSSHRLVKRQIDFNKLTSTTTSVVAKRRGELVTILRRAEERTKKDNDNHASTLAQLYFSSLFQLHHKSRVGIVLPMGGIGH
jgi:hypothetical protein